MIVEDVARAAAEGVLLIGLCQDTGRHFCYPRASSPFTLSPHVSLVPARGTGVIYSVTIMRTATPYALAYVELDEGPRMLTNIVDAPLEAIRIGQRVQLVFVEKDGVPVPMFRPA